MGLKQRKTETNAIKKPRGTTLTSPSSRTQGDREKNENTGRGETEEKIERRAEIQKEITRRAGEKKGSIHTDKD